MGKKSFRKDMLTAFYKIHFLRIFYKTFFVFTLLFHFSVFYFFEIMQHTRPYILSGPWSVCSSSDARDLRFSVTFCKWSSILVNQTGSFQGGRLIACVRVIRDTTTSKTFITPHQLIKKSWPRTWNIQACIADITIKFYTSSTFHVHINIIT